MTKATRWFWPGILLIPAVGLVVQEVLFFRDGYLGEGRLEQVESAAAWGLWMAAPFLAVAGQLGVATRRNRPAWWLAVAAGVGVTVLSVYFTVSAHFDDSTDPLAGLTWVLAPLLELGVAVPIGIAVMILTLTARTPTRAAG
jgi:uncharacterized membrane protein